MNRTDIINLVSKSIDANNYLEIGVFNPDNNFYQIDCPDKIGVDPNVDALGVIPITSDQFFQKIPDNRLFNLIFIDGDHRLDQVRKDLENSVKHLSEDGVIVVHDVNPTNESQALPEKPSRSALWCGEVWQAFIEYVNNPNFICVTVDCDFGVGLIRFNNSKDHNFSESNREFKKIDKSQLNYHWLEDNRKTALNLIPPNQSEILQFLGFASAIYYTDLAISDSILVYCFEKILQVKTRTELVVVTPKTTNHFNKADVVISVGQKPRSHRSLYEQILVGLEKARFENIFLLEHDVLYPKDYFNVSTKDKSVFHYNRNTYHVNYQGFFKAEAILTSNFYGDKNNLLKSLNSRLHAINSGQNIVFTEPGISDLDEFSIKDWYSANPTVDIRHGANFTGMRHSSKVLNMLPYWGNHDTLCQNLGL